MANPTSCRRCSGRSRHSGFRICIALCRTCAPILSAHHSIYHLKIGCCHPFREPLQFIVITVIGHRHVIVMVSVTEESHYLSSLLATVTAMTLMTVICGLILDEGMRLYFVGSLTLST